MLKISYRIDVRKWMAAGEGGVYIVHWYILVSVTDLALLVLKGYSIVCARLMLLDARAKLGVPCYNGSDMSKSGWISGCYET